MKKLIGTLVAALLAAAVFADVGVGAWGRGFWVPFGWDGDAKMYQQAGWGGAPRIGMSFGGSSDNVGFAIDVKADGGVFSVNDNAFIWVKPWSFLKIQIGQWFDDTLRGSCYFASWDWLRPSTAMGDDLTFARIYDTRNGSPVYGAMTWETMKGALISITPIEGLYIAAGLNYTYGGDTMANTFKYGQYQVGYTLADVVAIKAQYIGQGKDYGVINAAVDLLMIEGNKIAVGAYIPTSKDKDDVAISATYNGSFDALSLGAYVATKLPRDGNGKTFGLNIGVGVGYDLGDGMAVEGDVRANMAFPKDGDAAVAVSIGAYFSKGFSNGKVGIGAVAAFGSNTDVNINGLTANKDAHIAIPVKMEYWF